jgi:hypothetical protein
VSREQGSRHWEQGRLGGSMGEERGSGAGKRKEVWEHGERRGAGKMGMKPRKRRGGRVVTGEKGGELKRRSESREEGNGNMEKRG